MPETRRYRRVLVGLIFAGDRILPGNSVRRGVDTLRNFTGQHRVVEHQLNI